MGNTPNIRFKGFTDDWEQRKLGWLVDNDVIEAPKDGNHGEKHPTSDEYVEEGIPFLMASDIRNGRVDLENCKYITKERAEQLDKGFAREGDVLLTHKATIGEVAILEGLQEEYAMLTPQVTYYRILDNKRLSQKYLYAVFHSESFQNEMQTKAAQSTRPYIGISAQQNLTISLPCSTEEQQRIGEYFASLDTLITLHQRKCDETKKLKKFMLQKMFPKKDEKKPEIRFADFTDDWEQRKLGDNIIEYTEKTTINNQYPVLTSSRKGIFFQTEYYDGNQVASADNTGYNIVPYGYFTYRHMSDDEIFHFNINDIAENGIVSTLYPVFTTDENLDSRYLQYQLNYGREFAKYAILQKQGGSRTYMYLNKLKNLYLIVPKSVNEQKRISGYFMQLDNLITLHQRKCDEIKEIKKFMLQNMFPQKG